MLIDDTYNASFWIGIGVSLITNLIQAFAMAFQRKSHILNDHLYPRELRKPAYRRPLWLTSFIAYLGANITGTVFSVGYLPVVILAPIGAINLVFNAIAARVVLGDPFTVRSVGGIYDIIIIYPTNNIIDFYVGTLLIIVGALLVGLFGVIQEPNHSLEALLALYKRPAFIIYFSILESFILVTMVTTHLLEHFYHQWEEDMTPDQKLLGSWLSMADLKVYIGIRYLLHNAHVRMYVHVYLLQHG